MSQTIIIIQIAVLIIVGAFFLSRLVTKRNSRNNMEHESKRNAVKLKELRKISLNVPLSEFTRPQAFNEIIGQKQGVMALCAAMCGENPQHVLIYGPPGIGKTCAARLVLSRAKQSRHSPFAQDAKFVEVSATCIRYDERNIADPLIGSVHDPIYQGAGVYGHAGIPQPKPGAVTKAHGGILFIDEIGELHPFHLNKLLKILEDRCVHFESSYYNSGDKNTPDYIHDIFANGLPADFRLVGATTRAPHEISPAIRSRCMEVYLRPLYVDEIVTIAQNASAKSGFAIEQTALQLIGQYAQNGRDAVNLVQMSAGIARENGLRTITPKYISWVLEAGKYQKRPHSKLGKNTIGCVNGLAVYGSNIGMVIEVETVAVKAISGSLTVTGLIDEEELGSPGRLYRRKSTAKSSVDNVLTALKKNYNINPQEYYIHINLPGSTPIDGPSAGAAIAVSVFSAISSKVVRRGVAMTGEISINGALRAVGGVRAKVLAAKRAGAIAVIVPTENVAEATMIKNMQIIGAGHICEVISTCFYETPTNINESSILSAKGN